MNKRRKGEGEGNVQNPPEDYVRTRPNSGLLRMAPLKHPKKQLSKNSMPE